MATRASIHAWRVPGTEGPGGLQSSGSHGVGHKWGGLAHVCLTSGFHSTLTSLPSTAFHCCCISAGPGNTSRKTIVMLHPWRKKRSLGGKLPFVSQLDGNSIHFRQVHLQRSFVRCSVLQVQVSVCPSLWTRVLKKLPLLQKTLAIRLFTQALKKNTKNKSLGHVYSNKSVLKYSVWFAFLPLSNRDKKKKKNCSVLAYSSPKSQLKSSVFTCPYIWMKCFWILASLT